MEWAGKGKIKKLKACCRRIVAVFVMIYINIYITDFKKPMLS
jgi:hypothetical protein